MVMDLKQANRSQCERSLSAASSYTPPGKADFIQVHTTSSSYGSSEVAIDTKSEKSETPSRRWKTTLIRFGPLSGIFCMCLAVLSIVASLGILIGSDGNSIEKWETPPSTYIAIFTAVGNLSMRYAAVQGVVIAWWRRTMRGASIERMHYDWRSGTSIRGAFMAGRQMGLLGLACIFSTIVMIDGPLLQKAVAVHQSDMSDQPIELSVNMSPEIPHGYTGEWTPSSNFGKLAEWNPEFNATEPTAYGHARNDIYCLVNRELDQPLSASWYTDAALTDVIVGCPGTCKAKLIAPALAATACKTHYVPVNYTIPRPASLINNGKIAPPQNSQVFMVGTGLDVNGTESINAVTGHAVTEDCVGTLEYTLCSLHSAVGEYDVTITGNSTVIDSAHNPKILALANNTLVDKTTHTTGLPSHQSTLGGLVTLAYGHWDTMVAYFSIDGKVTAGAWLTSSFRLYMEHSESECPSYSNPQKDYMVSMNKLMVYTGMLAARGVAGPELETLDPGLSVKTTTLATIVGKQTVFHTNYWFFLAAALVEAICICLVAPTYLGWWKIGRPISFSPIEIAKAFEAPILAGTNSNSSAADIVEQRGNIEIKYGATAAGDSASKLAFAGVEIVNRPKEGMSFDC